jgi:hypothetical protein
MNIVKDLVDRKILIPAVAGVITIIFFVFSDFNKYIIGVIALFLTFSAIFIDWVYSKPSKKATKKSIVNVLIIDDEYRSFPIVKILGDKKKYPWINFSAASDVKTLYEEILKQADVVFVDIHGVGKFITPKTEGLGLAEEIMDKYPEKIVVLYSSSVAQDFTHPVLARVSGRLYKESEPRSFLAYVEDARK